MAGPGGAYQAGQRFGNVAGPVLDDSIERAKATAFAQLVPGGLSTILGGRAILPQAADFLRGVTGMAPVVAPQAVAAAPAARAKVPAKVPPAVAQAAAQTMVDPRLTMAAALEGALRHNPNMSYRQLSTVAGAMTASDAPPTRPAPAAREIVSMQYLQPFETAYQAAAAKTPPGSEERKNSLQKLMEAQKFIIGRPSPADEANAALLNAAAGG